MVEVTLNINGRVEKLLVEPGTSLLQVLRADLGLKAAKLGCALEQCYACAVLVDGEARPTCAVSGDAFEGRRITTLEGLADADDLHPVQLAFLEEGAAQCGYCIPGMIIGVVALLKRNPDPTDEETREALAPHLCRCGSHPRILRAVSRVAGGSR